MSEVVRLRGLLKEKQLKAKEIELKMATCLANIRAALPSYAPMVELKTAVAAQEAVTLATFKILLDDLHDEIAAIRMDLGE